MSSDMVIIARTPEGLQIFDSSGSAPVRQIPGALSFISSPQLIVATKESSVDVYNGRGENLLLTLPETGVILLALSPNAEHLVTCTKPVKDETGQPGKNMKVWSIKDGRLVAAVPQKQVSKDHWPAIHWSGDSSAFVHCVTNTCHIYEARDAFQSYRKLTIRGVTDISLAPEGPSHNKLCAFIPEAKGSPASAGIYDWRAEAPAGGEAPPLVKKSFFRTSGAQLMWNKNGSACLVLAFTDFDVTNQSYYGEQKLHYLPSDPAKSDKACTVDLKEGPVHDVKWSPNGDFFACVAGFIPSKVMLYDANCKPIFDFGSGPYNVVRWSPFGRFLAVCGFGNLPGDIVFWDKKQSGTCRQMGAVRSPAVTADWSPDGRSFLTATVAPRLRVDNNYKLFAYHGSQLTTLPFPTLFEASWAPVTPGTFTDRPQSPERIAAAASGSGSGGGPSAAPASVLAPKASGYVPPHLRGAGGGVPGAGSGGASKPQFSLAFDPNEKAGRIATASASAVVGGSSRPMSSKPLPPGAEPIIGEGSGKGAKKKSSSSKKSEAPSEAGEKQQKPSDRPGNGGDAKAKAVAQTVPAPAPNNASEEGGGLDEKAKRIRALNKKLRAISELREKIGDGAPSPEQASKLSTEEALMAELKQIELS